MPRALRTMLLAGVAFALFQQSAMAATTTVNMTDSFTFNPANVALALGSTVTWHNASAFTHTSTSDDRNPSGSTGVAWWDSGNVLTNANYSWAFTAAGKFPYHCKIHSNMTGNVSVKPKAVPTSGAVGDAFTITWSTKDLGSAFRYDVQILRPGSSTWSNWRTDTTAKSARFAPSSAGTYKFRARLERVSNHGVSNWSPARAITAS